MIQQIEELMQHWGEQHCHVGEAGGLGSPMATIMQYGGCAPRGTAGSRDLLVGAGAGMDHIACEVAAAVAELAASPPKASNWPSWQDCVICISQPCRDVSKCDCSTLPRGRPNVSQLGEAVASTSDVDPHRSKWHHTGLHPAQRQPSNQPDPRNGAGPSRLSVDRSSG